MKIRSFGLYKSTVNAPLLCRKETGCVSRHLDKSENETVDVKVTSQLSSAQRQPVVDQCRHHPTTMHTHDTT